MKEVLQNGWAYSWWCGDAACEAKVKEDTKATTRNIPLDQDRRQSANVLSVENPRVKRFTSHARTKPCRLLNYPA